MKFCRFQKDGSIIYGVIESQAGREAITRVLTTPPEKSGFHLDRMKSQPFDSLSLTDATLLVPVKPGKIICVGRNYRDHAAELGNEVPTEPLLFFKPVSSLLSPGGTILRPKVSQRTDYEGELGVVMGKTCHKIGANEDVRNYILGYTCINDFTARDLQNKDGQWTRAKGFDTFCPVGPVVTDEIDPWDGVTVETRVNGEVRQSGSTKDFIFPLDVILRYITAVMTLEPGDLVATGTPKGVGPVVSGDVIDVSISGIGTLHNTVADE